jgi:hypothetical protein
MRRLAVVLSLVVGAAVAPVTSAAPPRSADAVVALVDTGINPYHAVFRDRSRRAQLHPSTYLPGYPRNAVALRLTLDTGDYRAALKADCRRVWAKVRPGQLYWFPGTTIVGAVSFDLTQHPADCDGTDLAAVPVLDDAGHGTMTASRAVGRTHGGCPVCRVVSVEFQTGYGVINSKDATTSAIRSLDWLAANAGWIDVESNSWGALPVWDPTGEAGLFATSPALARSVERAARAHLAFWASGNGIARTVGLAGHPTAATPGVTPSAIVVGGHDSGQVLTWPGFTPHVVSDACDSWAAAPGSTREERDDVGGGTSGAAPYAAGSAALELVHARALLGDRRTGARRAVVAQGKAGRVRTGPLADGVLTQSEWRTLVLGTATPRPAKQRDDGEPCFDPLYPTTPARWTDVPRDAPAYPLIGYGAVDKPAVALARRVLSGTAAMPARTDEDRYFTVYGAVQSAAYTVYAAP